MGIAMLKNSCWQEKYGPLFKAFIHAKASEHNFNSGREMPSSSPGLPMCKSDDENKYRVGQKKFTRLANCGIKTMWQIFKSDELINKTKAKVR